MKDSIISTRLIGTICSVMKPENDPLSCEEILQRVQELRRTNAAGITYWETRYRILDAKYKQDLDAMQSAWERERHLRAFWYAVFWAIGMICGVGVLLWRG